MDGRPRLLHVGKDAGEEALALDQRLDRRGGRPGEVEIGVLGTDAVAGGERLGRGRGVTF